VHTVPDRASKVGEKRAQCLQGLDTRGGGGGGTAGKKERACGGRGGGRGPRGMQGAVGGGVGLWRFWQGPGYIPAVCILLHRVHIYI
jgi:hypothetical protein